MEERHNNTIIREFNRKAALLLAVLLPLVCGFGAWERYAQPKPPETLEEYMEENGTEPLSFSAESGFYEEDVVLEIDAPGLLPKGAKIHYTLDGEEPTQNSPVYKGPVRLTANGAVLPDGKEADEIRNRGTQSAEAEGPGKEGKKQNIKAEENTEEKGEEKTGEDAERNAEGGTAGMENASDDFSEGEPGKGTVSLSFTSGLEEGSGEQSQKEEDLSGASYAADNPASGILVHTVRARIICAEEQSDLQFGVYCLGTGLLPTAGDYIVCVDTDERSLYDYDTGILVGGRNLDEHDGSKYFGNFMQRGEEWTRPCHVAVFDGEGNLIEEHRAGMSVSGGMSRRLAQKSLNLAFGEPYGDPDGHLLLDVFPDLPEADCAHVGKYTHLRLRARSQVPRTFREAITAELADGSGERASTHTCPGMVFLNGSFYMLAELEPSYSNSLLSHRFNLPDTDSIEKKKGKESSVLKKMGVSELFAADLTKAENRKALEAAVDMDDYLLYYAINVLENNLDWPRNNVEAWRFTGEYDPENPYTDGRIRFVLFDSDKAYNTNPDLEKTFGTDTLVSMMENTRRGYGSRFRDVMAAEPYRDRFVTILCDLMNTSFRTDNVLSLMQQLCSSSEEEFRMFFTPDYMDRITEDQNLAMEAEAGYNTRIEKDLRKYFGLKEKYLMSLSAGEGVTITWNNMLLAPGEEYTCPYYRGVQVCLSASVSPGWSFDHWEINGEPVENDQEGEEPDGAATLIVDGGFLQEKGCTVRAVSVPVEGELFIIDEVSSAGTDDWIRLYNAGTTRVDTGAYCLSDDPDNERMFRLPSTILEPGEYCVVTCSKNTSVDTEILCRCNFSLTRGETLCLTPDEGKDVPADSLRIPYMSAGCTYGRKKSGAIFRWFDKRGVHTQD